MTLRIALVGNSHLAALRQGWERLAADYPCCRIEVFGAPANVWRQMRLGAGKVLSRHMNAEYGAAMLRPVLERLIADLRPVDSLRGVA